MQQLIGAEREQMKSDEDLFAAVISRSICFLLDSLSCLLSAYSLCHPICAKIEKKNPLGPRIQTILSHSPFMVSYGKEMKKTVLGNVE